MARLNSPIGCRTDETVKATPNEPGKRVTGNNGDGREGVINLGSPAGAVGGGDETDRRGDLDGRWFGVVVACRSGWENWGEGCRWCFRLPDQARQRQL